MTGFPVGAVFPVKKWETPERLVEWLCLKGRAQQSDRRPLLSAFKRCDFEYLKAQLYFLLLGPGGMNNAREYARQRRELARRLREAVRGAWDPHAVGRELEAVEALALTLDSPTPKGRPTRRSRAWAEDMLKRVPGLTYEDRRLLLSITAPEAPRSRR